MKTKLLFLFLLASMCGWGQILTFEFSALTGSEATASSNFNNSNLTSSVISRGSGLTASANSGRYNATSWAITSIGNAITGNDYMEFTITPNLGYQFSVSSIVVQWQRSGTGNTQIVLRSSLDDYANNLDGIKNVVDNTSTQSFTFTFAQANSSSPVTYRLYSYAEADTGTGGPGDGTGDDIIVNGTVTSACTAPTPTFDAAPSGEVCKDTSVTYTTQSDALITDYVWSIPGTNGVDYNITAGGTTTHSVTLTWLTGGEKTVTVGYTEDGCASTSPASNTITVNNVTVTPTAIQNIYVNDNGNLLTATAQGTAISQEWKYSTTQGTGYVSFSTPQTGTTYTPNFNTANTYYVVCETEFACGTLTSNEIQINVAVASFSGVTSGSGTEPATISSLVNTQIAASLNFDFIVTDDAVTINGNDALPTLINQIIVAQGTGNDIATWTQAIAGAELTDGINSVMGTVNATDITFASIPTGTSALGHVLDGTTKTYTLKVWLNTTMGGTLNTTIDGQNLAFRVDRSSFTTANAITSTQFQLGAGAAVESGSNNNAVSVVASQLAFVQQPTNTALNATMNPAVTVSANDANGNRDRNFTGLVEITSDGTLTGDPVGVNAVSGLATFSDLVHTAVGSDLTMLAGYDAWDVLSDEFDIIEVTFPNNSYHTASAGTWNSSGTGTATWDQWTGSGWSYNVTKPNATGDKNIFIHHNVSIPSSNGSAGNYTVTVMDGATLTFNGSSNWTFKGMTIENGSTLQLNTTGVYMNSGNNFVIKDGGNVVLNALYSNASNIWAGTEIFHPNSNFKITEWAANGTSANRPMFTGSNISTNTYNGYTAAFGNLEIDLSSSSQANSFVLLSGGVNANLAHGNLLLTNPNNSTHNVVVLGTGTATSGIGGDFIVDELYAPNKKAVFANSGSLTFVIGGDMQLDGSTTNLSNSTTNTVNITVLGNLNITPNAVLDIGGSAGTNSNINLNLEGDLYVAGSGLLRSQTTNVNFNFSKSGGNGLTPETTQNINVLSTSTNQNRNIAFNVNSGAYAQLMNNLTLGASSTFNIQGTNSTTFGTFDASTFTLAGTSSNPLTVNSYGRFKTANANGFSGSSSTSVGDNIISTLQTNSTVEYYANGNQTVSNQLFGTAPNQFNYQNLEITGTGIKTGAIGNIIVNQITKVNDDAKFHIAESDDIIIPNELPNVLTAKGGVNVSSAAGTELVLHNNANLMQDAGALNTGNITQMRKANVPSNQYNYWSYPVKNQQLFSMYDGFAVPRVMTYNTWNDYFTNITDNTTTAQFGIGYSVKGAASNPSGDVTAKFVGEPNNQSSLAVGENIALETYDDGNNFNLIGNPFPSNLDLTKMYDESNTYNYGNKDKFHTPTAYFWDNVSNTETTQQGSGYNQSNYATLNMPSGMGTKAPCNSISPNTCTGVGSGKKPNGIVKPGQGFIVNIKGTATPTTTTITLNNDMRTTAIRQVGDTEDATYFKNGDNGAMDDIYGSRPKNNKFWIEMVNPTGLVIQAAVGYFERADNTFEIYDSKIMSANVSENIYSLSKDAQKLTIQGRQAPFENTDVIPLGTKFYVQGKYKIQLEETVGIFKAHQNIYLKDKYLNQIHNLSESPYDFEGTPGVYEDRFEIIFQDGSNVSDPVLTTASDNAVKITKKDRQIEITSSKDKILEVEILNLSGWSIYKNDKVNSKTLNVPAALFGKQIVVVKVQTETGEIVTKKIINK